MMEKPLSRQLPVRLPPCTDELLSSWISRHAAFYAVPPLAVLRHCLPEAASLRTIDLHLRGDQEVRLASMFAFEPAILRRMTFTNIAQSSRRLIAARPTQYCPNCSAVGVELAPFLRSNLLGWRITCTRCGSWLREFDDGATPSPFPQYHRAALRGERLLDDEAERGIRTWTSPAKVAQLLLMRRVIWPLPREHEFWRYRVLGVIIPDLDAVVMAEREKLPTPAKPILPLHLRPALLAGVAIVERAGPEMLRMLSSHMMGENRARFNDAAETMMVQAAKFRTISQMHLI